MYFFYPGPAKLHPMVPQWTTEIFEEGLTSRNHRSAEIIACYRKAIEGLQKKLSIPPDYTVVFISSATECWEILAQSFPKDTFTHVFNGAFGAKWAGISQKLGNTVHSIRYSPEAPLPDRELPASDWICLTHCETSNGTYIAENLIVSIKKQYPERLFAIDATSSLGGIRIPWEATDYVFASVQKCLGLPSGMAVLVCSPQAAERALQQNVTKHYNSLANSLPLAQQYQTTHTPNILAICLLMKLMESIEPIQLIDRQLQERATQWYEWLEQQGFSLLIRNAAVRSPTVIAVQAAEHEIAHIKSAASQSGFVLGNGYGEWKNTTFRIANFPAITNQEVMALQEFLLTLQAAKQ
jgi:phosphoserine aminotransferase